MAKVKPSQDQHNANRGTARGRYMLEESMRSLGAGRSILLDRNGVAIAGNKTLEVAEELGLDIEYVHTSGDKLVAVVRDDLDLKKDAAARELAYADNRVSEVSLEWDLAVIAQDVELGLDLSKFFFDGELEALIDATGQFDESGDRDPLGRGDDPEADEDADPDAVEDGALLDLIDITIAEPRHQVKTGDIWTLGHHTLACLSVMDAWSSWIGLLKPGMMLCPYPGPMVPMTIKAESTSLLLIQPSVYIAGHILDRWEDIHGSAEIKRQSSLHD